MKFKGAVEDALPDTTEVLLVLGLLTLQITPGEDTIETVHGIGRLHDSLEVTPCPQRERRRLRNSIGISFPHIRHFSNTPLALVYKNLSMGNCDYGYRIKTCWP